MVALCFPLPVGLRSSTVKLMQCTESQLHPAQHLSSTLPEQALSQEEHGVVLSANLRQAGLGSAFSKSELNRADLDLCQTR